MQDTIHQEFTVIEPLVGMWYKTERFKEYIF